MKCKLIAVVIIILIQTNLISAQSNEVRFLVDTAMTIMKKNAVNANTVNWSNLQKTAYAKAEGITDPYKLGPVMRYLYESLNDFHGAFFYRDSMFQWKSNVIEPSDSIMNEWKKGVKSCTRILDDHIGYLRIPSMPIATDSQFYTKAQQLNDSLCLLLVNDIKGIVLDLRLDGGGAMQPMILGVEQLLTPGKIGSFHTGKQSDWVIKDNSFIVDPLVLSKITPMCNVKAQNIPVVMLISPVTGSAAECFIIAFKGRKNTVLLGSKTAGYVSVNAGFPVNRTAFMNLAIGYSADRSGKIYKDAIEPDIPFESVDKFNDIENDEKVKAAVNWLKLHLN